MAASISVHDLFGRNHYSNKRTLVVKNLPECPSQEGVQNYTEVVTQTILEYMCTRSGIGQAGIVIVVLDEDVDISAIRDKPFEGRKIQFSHLDDVAGIVVRDVGTIPEDTIELYFDSPKRSGGKEDTVKHVEFHKLGSKVSAVLIIHDKEAIASILSRPQHKISSQCLEIEPYFPSFHDYILDYMKKSSNETKERELEKKMVKECERPVIEHIQKGEVKMTQAANIPTPFDQETSKIHFERSTPSQKPPVPAKHWKQDTPSKPVPPPRPSKNLRSNLEPAVILSREGEVPKEAFVPKTTDEFDRKLHAESVPSKLPQKPWKQEVHSLPESKSNKLRIFSSDGEETLVTEEALAVNSEPSLARNDDGEIVYSRDTRTSVNKQMNAGPGLPRVRRNSNSNSNVVKMGAGQRSDTEKNVVEEIKNVSKTEIVLLKIGSFQRKCKEIYPEIDIILQEKQTMVILKANNNEDIKGAKVVMHDILNQKMERSIKIEPKERAEYLARQSVQAFIRNKSKNEKIGAVFEMKMESNELKCFALSRDVLGKGIGLVDRVFTKERINLREGQDGLVESKEWLECKDKVCTSDLAVIYREDSAIVIESISSLKKEMLKDMRSRIIDFLKSSTPKDKAVIEVNGGQAEYFLKYCEKNLDDKFRKKHVTLKVKQVKRDRPIKLELTVEGDKRPIDEVKQAISQIWRLGIDFQRIASEEGDVWQIMRCLDGDIGRQFFRHFQHDYRCVVEVVREGEVQPPSVRITHEIQSSHVQPLQTKQSPNISMSRQPPQRKHFTRRDSDASEDTDDELEKVRQQNQDEPQAVKDEETASDRQIALNYQLREMKQQERAKNVYKYQGEMSEEEAISLALQESLQSQEESVETRDEDDDLFATKQLFVDTEEAEVKANPYQPYIDRDNRQEQFEGVSSREEEEQEEEEEEEARIMSNEMTVGNTRVVLVLGQIAKQQVDALVNIVDPSGEFPGQSTVCRAFHKAGGQQLGQLYKQAMMMQQQTGILPSQQQMNIFMGMQPSNSNTYTTITGSSGNLQCTNVIHVKLVKEGQASQVIAQVMDDIYKECSKKGLTSLAIPPLGVGRLYKYDVNKVANMMLQQTRTFLSQRRSQLQEVRLVIYEDDNRTYRQFNSAMNKCKVTNPMIKPIISKEEQQRHARRKAMLQMQRHQPKPSAPSRYGNAAYDTPNRPYAVMQLRQASNESTPYKYGNPFSVARHQQPSPRIQQRGAQEVPQSKDRHRGGSRPRRTYDDEERSKSVDQESVVLYRRSNNHDGISREEKLRKKAARQSRFSDELPSPRLKVTVFAGSKEECEKARNDLGKKIKDEFLFEKEMEKRSHVSSEAKQRIAKVIERHKVKSVKSNGKYRLKGFKENVRKANEEILKILLEDKPKDTHRERKQRRQQIRRATAEFAKVMASDEPEVPDYWDTKPGEIVRNIIQFFTNKKYKKVYLDPNHHAYQTILNLINETFQADSDKIGQGSDAKGIHPYRQFQVIKICRIENLELYEEYARKRSSIFRRLWKKKSGYFPKLDKIKGVDRVTCSRTGVLSQDKELRSDVYEEVNESYFFHGTKSDYIEKICSEGLDLRVCNADAMFGQGIYGAETVVKADQYADDKTNRTGGEKKMFLMRMLLGDIYVCTAPNPHKYKRAPCTTCYRDDCVDRNHHFHFDSVVGGMNKLFREFVVYESKQCYPEYLITYERQ